MGQDVYSSGGNLFKVTVEATGIQVMVNRKMSLKKEQFDSLNKSETNEIVKTSINGMMLYAIKLDEPTLNSVTILAHGIFLSKKLAHYVTNEVSGSLNIVRQQVGDQESQQDVAFTTYLQLEFGKLLCFVSFLDIDGVNLDENEQKEARNIFRKLYHCLKCKFEHVVTFSHMTESFQKLSKDYNGNVQVYPNFDAKTDPVQSLSDEQFVFMPKMICNTNVTAWDVIQFDKKQPVVVSKHLVKRFT